MFWKTYNFSVRIRRTFLPTQGKVFFWYFEYFGDP